MTSRVSRRARRIASAAVVVSPFLAASAPVFATGRDGEEPGDSLSVVAAIGLFAGIPLAVIGLIYFIAYVPSRKPKAGSDLVQR